MGPLLPFGSRSCLPACLPTRDPPAAFGTLSGVAEKALEAGAMAARLAANATLAIAAVPIHLGAGALQVGGASVLWEAWGPRRGAGLAGRRARGMGLV